MIWNPAHKTKKFNSFSETLNENFLKLEKVLWGVVHDQLTLNVYIGWSRNTIKNLQNETCLWLRFHDEAATPEPTAESVCLSVQEWRWKETTRHLVEACRQKKLHCAFVKSHHMQVSVLDHGKCQTTFEKLLSENCRNNSGSAVKTMTVLVAADISYFIILSIVIRSVFFFFFFLLLFLIHFVY